MLAIGNDDDGNDCDAGIGSVQERERTTDTVGKEQELDRQTERKAGGKEWRES
jgi:hypothetical protein